MRVLIVYAHPEPQSFNGALKDCAIDVLTQAGHEVLVTDLYGMNFDPVTGSDDFKGGRNNPDFFSLPREQTHAFENDAFVDELVAEQEKLEKADLLILQFPMWWFGMPAIMKGWADRVFARGFAYRTGRKYDTGMFKGKLAMVSVTTGTSADTYAPDGIDGDILSVLWPIHNGLLRYSGFDVLTPFVSYMPGRLSREERQAHIDAFKQRLNAIDDTPRLYFHPSEDYDSNERLKPGVLARSGVQRNP